MPFLILSIHATTHSPQLLPAQTLERAMQLRNMVESEGHLLAEIIGSQEEYRVWQERVRIEFFQRRPCTRSISPTADKVR